ncbi:hypothetical protein [Almyronema epifaneia]|uniref:Uncharacterized protein n=1 Tax=Almyronema epifaneia S1 TaxID=2991925 RepID=A0ABW6IBU6_9CYAN
MLFYINPTLPDVRHLGEAEPVRLNFPRLQPERERLRHLIMGSPEGVREAVNTLHRLNYADQGLWNQLLTIPPSGILLTPEQGEVFTYLLRYRSLS